MCLCHLQQRLLQHRWRSCYVLAYTWAETPRSKRVQVSSGDMTTEAAVTKLAFLFSTLHLACCISQLEWHSHVLDTNVAAVTLSNASTWLDNSTVALT